MKKNESMRHRWRLLLLSVLPMVFVMLTFTLAKQSQEEQLYHDLAMQTQSDSQIIALSEEIPQSGDALIDMNTFNQIEGYPSSQTALVTPSGIIWDDISVSLPEWSEEPQQYRLTNGYLFTHPLVHQSDDYMLIEYYSRSVINAMMRPWIRKAILWGLFALAVSGLMLWLHRKILYAPLGRIQQGIDQIFDDSTTYLHRNIGEPSIDELDRSLSRLSNDLKNERDQLYINDRRLAILLDHINLGVIQINSDGKIELMNPEAERLLSVTQNWQGRNYKTILKSVSLVDMINQALSTHEILNEEIEIYIPSIKYIDVTIVPYIYSKEDNDAKLVLLYDITQVHQLETVRTEFVSNASHELRTPVTAIKGFAETLLNGALDTPEVAEEFVQIIADEGARLENLINDILELSRVEKKVDEAHDLFDLNKSLERLVLYFNERAKDKNIDVQLLPAPRVMLEQNQYRVEQIFINLIENAIKYSGEGGHVTITITPQDDNVKVTVADTGIGIPQADQERIFERFYRVDKARNRQSGGTGLGLSIVRNLVKNMEGSVWLKSQLGEGTEFYVQLPYRKH